MKKASTIRSMFAIPLAAGGIFAAAGFLPAWRVLEYRLYDAFLALKPAPVEDPSIVLLDVDEESIVRVGSYPWPRGLLARGLETLARFGAGRVVFDIEYLERSPMSVDRAYLEGGLRDEFDATFDEIGSNVGELFSGIARGSIGKEDAAAYGEMLVELAEAGKEDLYAKAGRVALENDSYLGKAMRLFGPAYATLNLQGEPVDVEGQKELRAIAADRFASPLVVAEAPVGTRGVDFLVPIPEISSRAAGAGFTNVPVDVDGVRRRIRLVEEVEGKNYLQLVLTPLIDLLGPERILFRGREVVLEGARYPDGVADVRIPLDSGGRMLIRWPKKDYARSFRHVSFYRLLEYRDHEDALVANLRALRNSEAWGAAEGPGPAEGPLEAREAAEAARAAALASGTPADREAWLAAERAFLDAADAFLAAGWESAVPALLDAARDAAPPQDRPLYDELREQFLARLRNCAAARALMKEKEADLAPALAGALCIVGWTATATTDIGANPFYPEYVNVGAHAAIANGILRRDFLREAPSWLGSAAAFLLAFAVILAIRRLSTARQIASGLAATVLVLVVSYALFHVRGVFVPTLAPTLAVFFSFLAFALSSFLAATREKAFLRKAFSTYLSGDVIAEIIDDPSMLKLGGQKKWMTAMFTDVRGFSTVSESLDPEQLVKLLNLYLSGMSDIVLENRGTIDKYEGDAIISFFGAPLPDPKHARAAFSSAVLMKKKEAELNARFLEEGLSPVPLLTRIGINTGDMVVGNMGTERKMDYTIMGNAVNLAARLEGVNKQYGTWILAADAAKKEAGDAFLTRRLDRVRVVGIHEPVQLWEVLGFAAEATPATWDFLRRFEAALAAFDGRDWPAAASAFEVLAAERPEDGPSAAYARRARDFVAKPPAAAWDGVFNLTEK